GPAVRAEGDAVPAGDREQIAVAEPAQVVPLEAAEVVEAGPVEELPYPRDVAVLPLAVGQADEANVPLPPRFEGAGLRAAPLPGRGGQAQQEGGGQQCGQRRRARAALRPRPRLLQGRRRSGAGRQAVEVAAQVVGQVGGRLVATGRLLLEALEADGFEVA